MWFRQLKDLRGHPSRVQEVACIRPAKTTQSFATSLLAMEFIKIAAAVINDRTKRLRLRFGLGVLPQLLARTAIYKRTFCQISVASAVGSAWGKHPQALMYPLSVLLKILLLNGRAQPRA
jgi:hypothetical protein